MKSHLQLLLLTFLLVGNLFSQENNYGLSVAPRGCEIEYEDYASHLMVLGNSYSIEGNKVILKYHDLQLLKKVFSDENDGIAVDLLTKEQFSCGVENRLNTSATHDGLLLPPVYRDELFSRNVSTGDFRYKGELATIPDSLIGKELVFSLLLINDGRMCKYLMPAPFSTADYVIQAMPLEFDETPGTTFVSSGIGSMEVCKYSFKTSKTVPEKPCVPQVKGRVHAVLVEAFSSIDGNAQNNHFLDSSRAAFIANDLVRKLKISDSIIVKQHGENWNLANYQFKLFGADSLVTKHPELVRQLVNQKRLDLPLDSLLFTQRICESRIFYFRQFSSDTNSTDFLNGNLLHALATKNAALFNKTARKIYELPVVDPIVFDRAVFDYALTEKRTVAAYAALLSRDVQLHQQEITMYLKRWFSKTAVLSSAAKFNLCQLYCLFTQELLKDWDVQSARMAKVTRPELVGKCMSEIQNPQLALNLNISFIKFYGKLNDTKNAQQHFGYISNYYFTGAQLDMRSAVKLAKYYNSWGGFEQARNLLENYYELNELSEEGVFVLAENELLLQPFSNQKLNLSYSAAARKLNEERWCKWMNEYIQNLRNPELKRWYCESCGLR